MREVPSLNISPFATPLPFRGQDHRAAGVIDMAIGDVFNFEGVYGSAVEIMVWGLV